MEHFNDKFYVLTDWDAPNFRLMETPEGKTTKENWKEVITASQRCIHLIHHGV